MGANPAIVQARANKCAANAQNRWILLSQLLPTWSCKPLLYDRTTTVSGKRSYAQYKCADCEETFRRPTVALKSACVCPAFEGACHLNQSQKAKAILDVIAHVNVLEAERKVQEKRSRANTTAFLHRQQRLQLC